MFFSHPLPSFWAYCLPFPRGLFMQSRSPFLFFFVIFARYLSLPPFLTPMWVYFFIFFSFFVILKKLFLDILSWCLPKLSFTFPARDFFVCELAFGPPLGNSKQETPPLEIFFFLCWNGPCFFPLRFFPSPPPPLLSWPFNHPSYWFSFSLYLPFCCEFCCQPPNIAHFSVVVTGRPLTLGRFVLFLPLPSPVPPPYSPSWGGVVRVCTRLPPHLHNQPGRSQLLKPPSAQKSVLPIQLIFVFPTINVWVDPLWATPPLLLPRPPSFTSLLGPANLFALWLLILFLYICSPHPPRAVSPYLGMFLFNDGLSPPFRPSLHIPLF